MIYVLGGYKYCLNMEKLIAICIDNKALRAYVVNVITSTSVSTVEPVFIERW